MPVLLRLAAFGVLWFISRQSSIIEGPTAERMRRLSLDRKARLAWRLVQDSRVPPLVRGIVVLPALYMASPIDLLPDVIPFVGRLDDAFVFGLTANLLSRFTPVEVLTEHLDDLEFRRGA
jgi:uncharacterized membrane protein YkvA (DUF1232 family)